MHEVRAQNSDVRLEPREYRLTDAECLDRGLIGAGEEVLVMRLGNAEDIAENMRKSERHGCNPFSVTASIWRAVRHMW